MKLGSLFFISILSQYFLLCVAVDTNLVLLQLVYRHGDRTPVESYPNDLYNMTTWDKYGGLGQLTQTGMKQHREFGKYLRDRYGNFLNKFYNRNEVLARSTDVDRTLMSTYSLLSGLYPPQDYQKFDSDLDWQPITVHTTDANSDMLFHPSYCAKYEALKAEVYNSEEVKGIENQYKDVIKIISDNSGFKNLTLINFWEIADTLFVEKTSGLPLPSWVTDDVYNKMIYLANIGFDYDYHTTEMARLTSGGILFDMRNNILKKANASRNQLFLYGAHDTYVAAMTKLLNISTFINQPPYAAAIAVELRQSISNANDYYVQIYLKNNTADQPIDFQLMTVYGCDQLCPLSKFLNITSNLVVKDFNADCTLSPNSFKDKLLTDVTLIISIAVIGVVCLLLIIGVLVNCRKEMSQDTKHERL